MSIYDYSKPEVAAQDLLLALKRDGGFDVQLWSSTLLEACKRVCKLESFSSFPTRQPGAPAEAEFLAEVQSNGDLQKSIQRLVLGSFGAAWKLIKDPKGVPLRVLSVGVHEALHLFESNASRTPWTIA